MWKQVKVTLCVLVTLQWVLLPCIIKQQGKSAAGFAVSAWEGFGRVMLDTAGVKHGIGTKQRPAYLHIPSIVKLDE